LELNLHIIIYTQYYPPEVGAPQVRLHELARGLMRHGIQVTVLTAMPSYPHGRIYDGYKGLLREENLDGVQVIRTVIYPTQSVGVLRRLLSYLSFIFSSLVIGSWRVGRADFLLTESPPLFLGFAGYLLGRWKKSRWIFNISDLWPESVVELGVINRESLSYKLSSYLEKSLYQKAWVITGQSRTILENIQERYPVARTKHLPNGVDTEFFQSVDGQIESGNFHIVYAGLHGMAQGLDHILRAAHKLPSMEHIDFTFVGDGPEKSQLVQLAKDLNLRRIRFLKSVSKEKIPAILRIADVLIIPLKRQLTGAVPSKLYEAMSMAKPVILVAESEAAQIVTQAKCGIVIRPGDIDGLVAAMIYLKSHPEERNQMGENGRKIAVMNHDRKRIVDEFAQFLTDEHARSL
jgi:colanic acid biosynthesis glycosyl transferase WcaI